MFVPRCSVSLKGAEDYWRVSFLLLSSAQLQIVSGHCGAFKLRCRLGSYCKKHVCSPLMCSPRLSEPAGHVPFHSASSLHPSSPLEYTPIDTNCRLSLFLPLISPRGYLKDSNCKLSLFLPLFSPNNSLLDLNCRLSLFLVKNSRIPL